MCAPGADTAHVTRLSGQLDFFSPARAPQFVDRFLSASGLVVHYGRFFVSLVQVVFVVFFNTNRQDGVASSVSHLSCVFCLLMVAVWLR